mgnify:FL=1
MTWQMIVVLALFVWVFVALIWKVADPIIVGISIPTVLALTGIVNAGKAFADFSNTTCMFFMAIFVLGRAIMKTGLADFIGSTVINLIGKTENRLTISVAAVASGMSAFLNDTGTTGCLMPIVAAMAQKAKVNLSRVYMTLAFFASMGGTITLVGTTPHIVASGLLEKAGYAGYGFFEFTKVGLPITIVGGLYMYFIGSRMLPDIKSDFDKVPQTAERNVRGMIITFAVFALLVISLATKLMPFHLAAILGSIIVIVTKCITVEDALDSFSMPTLFLVAGIFPLSSAMSSTGVAKMFVDFTSSFANGVHPLVAILIISGITTLMTQFMMGTSLSAIMLPLGILYAQSLGLDPRGVVMAIAVASSLAFCTPFGTGPNLLVWKPGNYEISDYFKAGLPIVIIAWLMTGSIVYYAYELCK